MVRIPGIMNSIGAPAMALTRAPPPAVTPHWRTFSNRRTCPNWTPAATP